MAFGLLNQFSPYLEQAGPYLDRAAVYVAKAEWMARHLDPGLSEYVLQPLGLLALLGLIPLIIFYLSQPRPKERTMPSMAFFLKEKKSGKLEQALTLLKRNLLFLLHVCMILLFGLAIANLYLVEEQRPREAVIVFDRSASMADDMDAATRFVEERLGERNTVILVDDEVTVPLNDVRPGRVRSWLRSIAVAETETDIAGGLELAGEYPGAVVVASDLDQSTSDRNVVPLLKDLDGAGRTVMVMETRDTNEWGIVDVRPGPENTSIDIKNFLGRATEVTVSTDDAARKVPVAAGAVTTIRVQMDTGENIVSLPSDGVPADNTAYILVPADEQADIVFISDEPNPFMETVIELIPFTRLEAVRPPLAEDVTADVYVVGKTDRLLSRSIRELERQVQAGEADMIVFGDDSVFERFSSLPVSWNGSTRNATVEIREPQRVYLPDVKLFDVGRTRGESLATENGVVTSSYGAGTLMFYNLAQSPFRFNFLYPVFWKHLFDSLVDIPSIHELNTETGDTVTGSAVETPTGERSGTVTMDRAGFYTAGTHTYAANLVSADESTVETPDYRASGREQATTNSPLQHLLALLLVLFAVLELVYLLYEGVF